MLVQNIQINTAQLTVESWDPVARRPSSKGEKSKSFSTYTKILSKLADLQFDRSDALVAFGGGVVGDITGFCAATYLRGIDFIQIPTTLLSQVDSSVGGKTAINIEQGKNLVGAFYNPRLVLISTKYLETLSDDEYKSGLGEVAKYAFIGNKKLCELKKNMRLSKIMTLLLFDCTKKLFQSNLKTWI